MKKIRYSLFYKKAAVLMSKFIDARLAAYLTYKSIEWPNENKDIIVCLYRESFIKDIQQLKEKGHENYAVIHAGFTRFQQSWLPDELKEQTYYQRNEKTYAKCRERSSVYFNCLIRLIEKRANIKAFVSANVDYWQDSALKEICRNDGIPFIVLSREHPVIDSVCEFVHERYLEADYKFKGDLVAVAGESSKKVLVGANVVSKEKVKVIGLPRFDIWMDFKESESEKKYVTLLTFSRGYKADDTFINVLHAFVQAANKDDTEREFIIKTKDQMDTDYIVKLIDYRAEKVVKVTHEIDMKEVLSKSKLVIGYNSLSLIEAALAKATIVIPTWGECNVDGADVMYKSSNSAVRKVVSFAPCVNSLYSYIESGVGKSYTNDEVDDFVSIFIERPHLGSAYEFEKILGGI